MQPSADDTLNTPMLFCRRSLTVKEELRENSALNNLCCNVMLIECELQCINNMKYTVQYNMI